jgi:hypothetical protein
LLLFFFVNVIIVAFDDVASRAEDEEMSSIDSVAWHRNTGPGASLNFERAPAFVAAYRET